MTESQQSHSFAERLIEKTIFASRWLLAPIYLGLAAAMILLLIKFAQKSWDLLTHALTLSSGNIIIGILALVDLSLIGNLLLMIILSGYQNFVSKLNLSGHKDKPDWVDEIGFGDLKLKLMTSIVAISAIELLKNFMNLHSVSNRDLAWSLGIHMSFVTSGVLLALMDFVMSRARN